MIVAGSFTYSGTLTKLLLLYEKKELFLATKSVFKCIVEKFERYNMFQISIKMITMPHLAVSFCSLIAQIKIGCTSTAIGAIFMFSLLEALA